MGPLDGWELFMSDAPLTVDEIKELKLPQEQIEFILALLDRVPEASLHLEDGEPVFHGIELKNPVRLS